MFYTRAERPGKPRNSHLFLLRGSWAILVNLTTRLSNNQDISRLILPGEAVIQ
jgi:hypothetical protein